MTIKLTDAVPTQSSPLVLFTQPVSVAQGLSVSFDLFAYGGSGGDGIAFFFVDGAQSPIRAGGFGASLGYAPRFEVPGIQGGYLGIGFDEFGLYSDGSEGRTGGIGRTPSSVAVRGSELVQYAYLGGTPTLPVSLSQPTREASRRRAQVSLDPQGQLTVRLDLNGDGDVLDANETLLNFNVIERGNSALPNSLKFGFTAATGASTNVHEVDNFSVTTFDGTPLPGNFTSDLLIVADQSGTTPGVNTPSQLQGTAGNDIIIGGSGTDVITGGAGADRFVFRGATRAQALRQSTLRRLDRITDFNAREGDRVQLDFDNNLATSQQPRGLFNAGRQAGRNLLRAARSAYADKDQRKRGNQRLRANEAVFFQVGSRTYLSVNDNRAPFSPTNDLLVDVTGIQFARPADARAGTLRVSNYFV